MLNTTTPDAGKMNIAHAKKRILWIDIAKAIAIFAMIQGHTAPYGEGLRNFIYSFHMPLFFILTGFTSHPPKTWNAFGQALKKDFVRLIFPYVGIQMLNGLLSFLINHENAADSLKLRVDQLLWGSAFEIYGHSSVGMIWFLLALFWSKTLFNLIQLLFPTKLNVAIFLSLALLGKILSAAELYLPQSLDVSLVAALFLYLGYIFKQIYPVFQKYQIPITLAAFCFWILCWERGWYIDLGGRWYPDLITVVLEAICGCLCIFTFSQAFESRPLLSKALAFIGRNTLIILYVSFLDWIAYSFWSSRGYGFAYVARPAIVLFVSFIVVMFQKIFSKVWCSFASHTN